MAQIGNNENALYENVIADTREIEMAAKRALYWSNHPEVASQLAQILSTTWQIRQKVIMRSEARHRAADRANGNGKVE